MSKIKRTKKLFWIVCIIIFAVVVITFAGKFWIVPSIIRWEVEQGLSKFWDGQVNIEDIEVDYFGPIYFRQVRFIDKTGWQCLQADRVKMVLGNWPGVHPVVTEIEIEELNLQILTADGKFTLPFTYPSEQLPSLKKRLDIRKLAIKDAEITASDAEGSKTLYDNLQLLVTKKDNFYDFLFNRIGSAPSESLLAKGKIDSETLETELSLQMKHTVKKQEMALIFAALNIPRLSAEGEVTVDLIISGCVEEPAGLKPEGTINLEGWTVVKDDKMITNNLTTEAKVKDRSFGFDNITATVCNADIVGSLYIETKQNQPTEFRGQVLVQKMSFVELTSVLGGPGQKATKGAVTFNYSFFGKGKDLQKLSGEGQIFLDDADITVIPIVPHIFRTIGLSKLDPLMMSDAECTFLMSGPVATIGTAHIANRFAAIKVERGGIINLQTEQINIYVIAAPLKQIGDIIKNVPIVNIFANLKDKLTRLHVYGHWSDPPAKLITKEPIKDIKEATVGFLQDVIKSGGQITQEMRKRLGNSSKPKNEQKND